MLCKMLSLQKSYIHIVQYTWIAHATQYFLTLSILNDMLGCFHLLVYIYTYSEIVCETIEQ